MAALDGGLQLALLWARDTMGGAALPMAISEVRMAAGPPTEGSIACTAQCQAASKTRGTADVIFHCEDGNRIAELKGVELILRPNN